MNISICTTVLNEEESIGKLLDSLLSQSKKASEIVIVDADSKDKTVEIIRHFQKKNSTIKLIIEKSSRAKARNIACDIARSPIIAMTDAGCVADKDWLKNLTKPFETGRVDVVAGFYKMTGETKLQKAESVFLGVMPRKFNNSFLPSTRSMAFTKEIWERIGGFPENISGTAEDTMFNKKLIENKAKISRVKEAVVGWGMPESLREFVIKIKNYSRGDAKSKVIIFPGKGIMSHNIKAISIFLRYLLLMALLIFSFKYPISLACFVIFLFLYFYWSYRKIYLEFGDLTTSLWGPVLQISSDVAVMHGFISGIIEK